MIMTGLSPSSPRHRRSARTMMMVVTLALAAPLPAQAAAPTGDSQEAVATAAAPYLLGTGDKLRISVFGETRFDGEYAVTGAGNISFPLIGSIPARGQTVEAVQAAIAAKLAAGHLRDPRVSAEVLNYRPYYILGEIGKPGEYPFVIGLTVQQAVAIAGGFSYRANTRRVFIKRALDTSERPIDIKGPAVTLTPGDTVRVGERFF